ncbi:hypothetical protein PQR70_28635 [Paraburkholderia madseniana]|uniref:Uncharacterized protein n=1 Tax=Paraburkholderia madseniana TaxID=2599607 RepID=A0AAP5EXU0_9BURK|nr:MULTISPECIES: hypothetical protein [Paraburkholderia]MCX4149502.1 hypothetical protein [Paraburkholderia madseniana]MDN7152438.1 hypothetical protein [Paraburkholderia sp. WS6]MDQ6411320.1 hypothetical protein [Paraburkholderia madseniana]
MLSNVIQAFVANLLWSLPLLIAAVFSIFFAWKRYTDDLWWADFWVCVPLVGKMRRWKRQTHGIENVSTWKAAGLPPAEESLCSTYIDKLPKVDPVVFARANEYLKITHQNGRSPTSAFTWAALWLLTIAEAAGTGMLIAPFVASEITGNQMVWIGYVIATVMAVGLLGLTHAAGKDVYKRSAIRKALGSVNETVEGYTGHKISSGDDQAQDEGAPPKVRFGSRVLDGAHDRGSLVVPIVAIALLAVLLIGITWMRIKGLQIEMTNHVADHGQMASGSGSNPFPPVPGLDASTPLPTDVADSSRAAQQSVDHELNSEMFSQGIAGAIVLAIIYVITQALGFFQAFGSSFVGDGKNAYQQTLGHTSFQSYFAKHIKPTLDRGNMRLTELRAHLGREVPRYRENVSKISCHDFYSRKLHEDALRPVQMDSMGAVPSPTESAAADRREATANTAHAEDPVRSAASTAVFQDAARIAERILDESDQERRKVILDVAADGSAERRSSILAAVQTLKLKRKEAAEQARLEDDILGDI